MKHAASRYSMLMPICAYAASTLPDTDAMPVVITVNSCGMVRPRI